MKTGRRSISRVFLVLAALLDAALVVKGALVPAVVIDRFNVTVKEGDLPEPPPPGGAARPLDLELKGVTIRDGSFVYVRESPGLRGSLGVSRLSWVVGPVGSSRRLKGEAVEARAEGVLEDSGKFQLESGANSSLRCRTWT